MHDGAREFIERQAAKRGPFSDVLEIGSRNINGGVRPYFADARYLGIDRMPGLGVDFVADAANGWEPQRAFDGIVCCEVFEHESRWPQIIGNIARWLAPHGIALLTMASDGREPHSGIDGGPPHPGEFYANVTPAEFTAIVDAHDLECELDLHIPGDLYAAVWHRGAAR